MDQPLRWVAGTVGLMLLAACADTGPDTAGQARSALAPAASPSPSAQELRTVTSILEYAERVWSVGQLVSEAPVSVRATATTKEYVHPAPGVVWTKQQFRTVGHLWGDAPQEFDVVFYGGVTKTLPAHSADEHPEETQPFLLVDTEYPQFEQGSDYLLFLRQRRELPGRPWKIVGHGAGHYRVRNERLESSQPSGPPVIGELAGRAYADVAKDLGDRKRGSDHSQD